MGEGIKSNNLIYPELSYEIVKVAYDVFNNIGPDHPESVYQNAFAAAYEQRGIIYQEQVYDKIEYAGKRVGFYYLDFLVDNKIVVELKIKQRLIKADYDQVKKYLSSTGHKLGIIFAITKEGVKFQRVLGRNNL
jgi:GxxExxY protein